MDDLSYYDDVGALQPFVDSGPATDPVVLPDPYAPPYIVTVAPDPTYQDVPVVLVDAPVAITPVTIAYDPGPTVFLPDAPVVAVYDPVYIEPAYIEPVYVEPVYAEPVVLVLPIVTHNSYVLDGTQGSIPAAILDFHGGDDVTVLGYLDGFDGWGFLGAGDPGGSLAGPTVVGSLDGASASFAMTLAGLSASNGLGVSSGVTPDGVGYLHIQS